jgi:hypothetical protein
MASVEEIANPRYTEEENEEWAAQFEDDSYATSAEETRVVPYGKASAVQDEDFCLYEEKEDFPDDAWEDWMDDYESIGPSARSYAQWEAAEKKRRAQALADAKEHEFQVACQSQAIQMTPHHRRFLFWAMSQLHVRGTPVCPPGVRDMIMSFVGTMVVRVVIGNRATHVCLQVSDQRDHWAFGK